MTRDTADALRRVIERSAFRDPSADDEDRALAFRVALASMHDADLAWLASELTTERARRNPL